MKPHLPARLFRFLLATCVAALTTSAPVFADVPEGYEPVIITNVDQLADYTESDYIAFIISSDIMNSAYRMTGDHQYWTDDLGTHALTFEKIESDSNGGALYINSDLVAEHLQELSFSQNKSTSSGGGAIYGNYGAALTLNDNENVTFSENSASSGGAIRAADYNYNSCTLNLTGNGSVTFSGNSASTGGAIYGGRTLNLTGNGAVTFCGNSASYGGAIYSSGTLSLEGNGAVTFCGNSASAADVGGGAIYGRKNSTISLKNNEAVTFSGNSAYYYGGAVCDGGSSTIILAGNETVTFSRNSVAAAHGGAIYGGNSSTLSLAGNGAVSFSGNSALYSGGAIYSEKNSTINLTGNGSVEFTGNYTTFAAYADASVVVVGDPGGGAIYSSSCTINLTNNEAVTFRSNHTASYGGAIRIRSGGTLNVAGNGSVTFRGNYEQSGSTYRMRGVYATGALKLAAGDGQAITFYDTLYAAVGTEVSFNDDFTDKDGVTQKGTGDIVFSGKLAEQNLRELKAAFTQQELTDSLTTEVYATTNLYGGRLRIEDGAIYKGNGINVAAGSNAALRLAGGTLDQAGYDVLLNAGTTLDLAGENNITASTLEMMDGSTLSFNAGATEGVMLNLDAALKTGDLHVTVSGDLTKEYALLQLADVSQYDFTQWNSGKVSVSGTDYEHLIWKDGVLTYKPWESAHTDLDKDTEVDDFGGEEGVEIDGHGHSLTVKHPVDLVHLAMKDGVVKLEGEENNVVRITLTEDGTLQIAAGAGLNVGNIVSMVATGDADLVISGDIEISDIKAYGKPGNKGTLSYVNMTTAGDYTIENMTISGSVIDVGEGTTLYLVNVDIKADTHITDDPAHVFAQGTLAQLDKTNTWVDKEITAAQDTLLYVCGNTQRSITLAVGSEIVELTSSMFDSVTLTGTDLWLDMTGIAEFTYNKDYFTMDFQDLARKMAKAQVDVENLHVYATLDGEKYAEAYSTANGGLTTTLYFSTQIPEPSTGTLSLLALAALAARRKKK